MLLAALRAHAFLPSILKVENPLYASRRVDGPLESHDDASGAVDAAERPSLPSFQDRFA